MAWFYEIRDSNNVVTETGKGFATHNAAIAAGTILGHDEKHIEQRPTTTEPALLTDGAIISTATFSTTTTIQLPSPFSNQFE